MKKYIIPILIGLLVGSSTMLAATSLFSDLKGDEFYAEAAMSLKEKAIFNGYENGTFGGENNVTRGELAMVVSNLLDYLEEQETQEEKVDEKSVYYESEALGIRFKWMFDIFDSEGNFNRKGNLDDYLDESEDKISFEGMGGVIEVLKKNEDESIEEAVLNLVAAEGKNPEDCTLVKSDYYETKNGLYKLDLADPQINYSEEELSQIAEAEEKELNGSLEHYFESPEYIKMLIYRENLIQACGHYSDPIGIAHGKSWPALFEYNDYIAPDRFVFLQASLDIHFYEMGSIEFLK